MQIQVVLIAPSTRIVGGQSIQADRLRRAFVGHHTINLELRCIDPQLPALLRKLPILRTLLSALVYYPKLVRSIGKVEVVHAFTSSFWGYTLWVIPAVWVAGVLRRKIVVNYHDGRAELHLRDWPSAIATLRRVNRIVVPSRYLVEVFAKFGLKAEVIPNMIDVSTFMYRERAAPRPVFLTNRGLEPLYDVPTSLRAFRLIQDRYPEAKFIVANNGPLRTELEALAVELGLNHITFTGTVTQQKMAELYDEVDIYVMSPRIDNMPLTVLECFASGLPVVSTNSGGVPYIAQHEKTALLVEPGSPEQIANACFRFIEEPELALRVAREGYRECVERYSISSVRDQWARLYADMTGIPAANRKEMEVATRESA